MLDKEKVRILPEHNDPVHLAEEFNQYYLQKIEKLRKTIPSCNQNCSAIEMKRFDGCALSEFEPTTDEELREIIKEYGVKTSTEDPIPANILKVIIDDIIPTLTILINQSLSEGSMNGVKLSVIDPLLKKAGLDSETRKNYRPVNNLVFFSKLIERVVMKILDNHMSKNALHTDSAFGYKTHHSTEGMMLGITNEILTGFDNNQCTVMIFLDLSAAFDTIDIEKMIRIMETEIGVTDIALSWIRSFLSGRKHKVKIINSYSS